MKVRVTTTRYEEVDIHPRQIKEILLQALGKMYGMPPHAFVKNGDLLREDEVSAGSHSYFEETKIRKADEKDKWITQILSEINGTDPGTFA